jgi:transposase
MRLVRYVENAVTKRNIADVAREVALSEKQVQTLAADLIQRLKSHRFPQPDVVAMDGIKCNDTRFQIISDGRTGKPLAINKTWEADKAWTALRDAVDVTQVRVFVTDMHLTNKSLADTLRAKTKGVALHVADRFHVIHACNKAISKIINAQVNALRGKKRAADANELLALKAKIEGKRTAEEKKVQIEFDFDFPPALNGYPKVQLAHRARMQLGRVYRSEDRETARRRLHEFDRMARDAAIADRFEDVADYLRDHEAEVLNYFDALETRANGDVFGFDTSRAERRNADIKDIWRTARGEGLDMFSLRVLYHPYTFGIHIIEHGCGHFEGPLSPAETIARSQQPVASTACPACAIENPQHMPATRVA